jgi:hypothetical protein
MQGTVGSIRSFGSWGGCIRHRSILQSMIQAKREPVFPNKRLRCSEIMLKQK